MFRELKRKIGLNFNVKGEAEVRFWSPEAEKVELKTAEVTLPLEKKDFGYWELSAAESSSTARGTAEPVSRKSVGKGTLQPGISYQFLIDGKTLIPDPASLSQPEGVHGPSQALDLSAFAWTDGDWKNPSLQDYIFYELHTGTFTPEGTFKGIMAKLDHLVELGITAIEIMPVAQFPGGRNWGYDGVFPFAVQDSYGGAAGLQQLVDACHGKGLAVVLDVVYNHMGPEGNYFEQAGPYFTDKYHTPWGSAINFDDAWSDGVREYFIENVLMWFRDFHIDALRLDAVHAIKDLGVKHLLQEISEEVDGLMQATQRKHYLIAECDLNDNKYINPPEDHGYGMDAQWIDEFHHALRVTAGEPATGYYSDFSGIKDLEKSYRDAYIYDGIYSPHRLKTFGGKAEGNPGSQFVVFSQNHDQVGNRMLGERSSTLVGYEMQKLMAGAVICSPFLPMFFMGEEWGETHPFLFFTSHGDPELIRAVSKGRKAEFAAFHADGEAPEPQSEDTFNQSKLQWELLQSEGHSELLSFYQTIIGLRKKYAPLRNTNRRQLSVSSDASTNCLLLRRWEEEVQVLCLMNFSGKIQDITIPDDIPSWKKVLDSADPQWKGKRAAPLSVDALQKMEIQPQSILIYTNKYA